MCSACSWLLWFFFFFKQKTAYEMRISDWSSDVCSSDLQAVFDDFGIACPQFAWGQSGEHAGIDQHQRRLMEGSDQILARRSVDRGLAADRRIDLREERGGHLDEVAAALHDRCGKADEIAAHAAAKGDDMIIAFDAQRQQPVDPQNGREH